MAPPPLCFSAACIARDQLQPGRGPGCSARWPPRHPPPGGRGRHCAPPPLEAAPDRAARPGHCPDAVIARLRPVEAEPSRAEQSGHGQGDGQAAAPLRRREPGLACAGREPRQPTWPPPPGAGSAEIRFPVRLRLDNDPAVRRFYGMLSESNNRMARLRAASHIYLAWLDGELTMPEPVAAVVFPDEDEILSPEDIFGF